MVSVLDSSLPAASVPSVKSGERGYYSISEAAALLGVSRVSIWRWIRAGHLTASRLGHRTTRIKRDDLERILVQIGSAGSSSSIIRKPGSGESVADGALPARIARSTPAPRLDWTTMGAADHFVQFYDADAYLLEAVANFIGTALRAGDAGIVVATPQHREAVERRLLADGFDLAAARAGGRYVSVDAAETLATLMVDGTPDAQRFVEVVGGIVASAATGCRRVRIFGEMVALLVSEGRHRAAIRVEALWNDLQQTHSFSLFCAYPMDRLGGQALAEVLGEVCAAHSHVIPAESYTALPTPDERLRVVTVLQQKARWLEAEIAERKRAEERLQAALAAERAAREAAEDALRVRDEFLSIAAHELKTPVTGLRGYAQLLLRWLRQEGTVDQERLTLALRTIDAQSDKLTRLVTQLLDVSRLERGKLALDCTSSDLRTLVVDAVQVARAKSAGREIAVDVPGEAMPAHVDPLRIEQVLANLLDNAIKYSPEGRIKVTLLVGESDGQRCAEIGVRDDGPGIPPEHHARIFEPFYQASGHRGGMGLGLYISRQIVELHGGEIRAESPVGGGARLVVRLPIESPTP